MTHEQRMKALNEAGKKAKHSGDLVVRRSPFLTAQDACILDDRQMEVAIAPYERASHLDLFAEAANARETLALAAEMPALLKAARNVLRRYSIADGDECGTAAQDIDAFLAQWQGDPPDAK